VNRTNVASTPEPATPVLMGVLLFDNPMPRIGELTASVSAEHVDPPGMLPKTASAVPLFGLLGLGGIASSLSVWLRRKSSGA
jgi:LPXTG-motif cell wall-anchored protein